MNHDQHAQIDRPDGDEGRPRGHRWMMIACCIPMLVIAVALVAAGVVSPGFLLIAVGCTALMMFMMRGMSGDDKGGGHVHR